MEDTVPQTILVEYQRSLDEASAVQQRETRIGLEPFAIEVNEQRHTRLQSVNWVERMGNSEHNVMANQRWPDRTGVVVASDLSYA